MSNEPDKDTAEPAEFAEDAAEAAAEAAAEDDQPTDVHTKPVLTDVHASTPLDADDHGEEDDDQPTAEAARPEAPVPAKKPSAAGLRIARLLLAPVLATAAVGVHYSLNVPEHPVVVKKPAPNGARNRKTALARKPPERNPQQMQASWDRWSVEPYDGEPIKGKWGRQMQSLMSRGVVVARKFAFAGAPEAPRVVAVQTECRTIRCRFMLRSPFKHEVMLIAETLEHLQAVEIPLFRHVEYEFVDAPKDSSTRDDHYLQVTVGINVDGVLPKEIEIDPEYAAEQAKAAPAAESGEPQAPTGDETPNGKAPGKRPPAVEGEPAPKGDAAGPAKRKVPAKGR